MLEDKHIQKIQETMDEIQAALHDSRGLVAHQVRLASTLSLGSINLIELYLHKKKIMKPGGRLEHQWFRSKQDTILARIGSQIISPMQDIPKITEILMLANKLEKDRNDLFYGSPVGDEAILSSKINSFLELKKLIESEIGGIN